MNHCTEYTIQTEKELEVVAKEIVSNHPDNSIFILYGNLGTGKTTLVKYIGKELGCSDEMSSPTYSLVNEYQLHNNKKIYHIDLYRLNTIDEAIDIGIEDYMYSKNYCFIEWPELVLPLLPDQYLSIHIKKNENDSRQIRILA